MDEAGRTCREVLKDRRLDLSALVLSGRTAVAKWSARTAVAQLRPLVERDEASFRSLLLMSIAQRRLGNLVDAARWARKALDLEPDDFEAIVWCGSCSLALGEFPEAEKCFQAALKVHEERADLLQYLAISLRGQGLNSKAVLSLRTAVELAPGNAPFRIDLVESLIAFNELEEAQQHARFLIEQEPLQPIGYLLLGHCLLADNLAEEAGNYVRKAIELVPSDAAALATYGSVLMALGQLEEAEAACERSIDLEPRQGLAYFNLIRSHRITERDGRLVEQMTDLVDDGRLPPGQRTLLCYALGKSLEDLGDYERAMRFYEEGNRLDRFLKFGEGEFDMEINRAAYEAVEGRFSAEFLSRNRPLENSPVRPIFVFGMIRSGTTLLEQILSSHPEVGGAGEQRFWLRSRSTPFTENDSLRTETLSSLAGEYGDILERYAPGKRFVVDKMPTNYMQLGLLHLAFPNAPMIHIRREPLDTCLSIYATYNRVPIPWANCKGNVVVNYKRYETLMEHWGKVLPEGRILEVRYEDLVSDPQPVIERILAGCGLDRSPACLHPELNPNGVTTPSVCQVRQPIYTTSVARWRKFEPWLGELANLRKEVTA